MDSPAALARRVVAMLAASLLPACGMGSSQSEGPGTCPIPDTPGSPRFAADLVPALQSSCGAGQGTCHGSFPDGYVSFATGPSRTVHDVWADLVGVPPTKAPAGEGWLRVAPREVDHSWLIAKITLGAPGGSGYGERMPLGAPVVCAATIDAFGRWISAGASDD